LRDSVQGCVVLVLSLTLAGCGSSTSTKGCSSNCPPTQAEFLYAYSYSGSGNSALLGLSVNVSTGALGSPISRSGPAGSGGIVATSGKFLYVSDAQLDEIDAFSINASSGALTPITGSPFSVGSFPALAASGLAMDPQGKFLFVTETSGVVVGFHVNDSSGALTRVPGAPVFSGSDPLGAVVDRQGKFLYVANTGDSNGSLSAFAIDSGSGALTAVPGSPFPTVPDGGPQFLAVHSSGKFLYVSLGGYSARKNLVGAFTIEANGALTPVAGSPFVTGTYPLGIAIDPAGKVLYTANNGDGTISAFNINPNTGALAELSGSPFSAGKGGGGLARGPFDLSMEPTGKVLYSSDAVDPAMLSFAVDSSGALSPPVITDTAGAPPSFSVFVKVQ
jgi:6-phosphogluconolactonase